MITKSYQFECEYCGHADHWFSDKATGIRHFRREDWIITTNGLVFCTKECYNNYIKTEGTMKTYGM